MSGEWSLETVSGPIETHPPIRVMFLVHCFRASGCLTIRIGAKRTEIWTQNGRIVGLSGAPMLLSSLGIRGSPEMNLEMLLGKCFQAGVPLSQAMEVAAQGVGDILAQANNEGRGTVEFELDKPLPSAPMQLPTSIPNIISGGLRRLRHPEVVRRQLSPVSNHRIQLVVPDNIPQNRWGFPPVALRLIRRAEDGPTLNRLLRSADGVGREDEWSAADLLMQLGMLTFQERRAAPAPEPAPEPAAQDYSEELRVAYNQMRTQKPWEILKLESAQDVNDVGIERACHRILADYHPDRFLQASEASQTLANECYALVTAARDALLNEALRTELRARLETEQRGEVYVSPVEQKQAEMLYTRGQIAFRRQHYGEAIQLLKQSYGLDPRPWRTTYMLTRAQYHDGAIPGVAAADTLLDLEGPRGAVRADVMFAAGEILLRENEDERAYGIFEKIVEFHAEHIGARRHLRLRERRTKQASESESSSLLGGLFSRLKR